MLRLSDEQLELIRTHLPEEHHPDDRPGCQPIPACNVFEAVLCMLNTSAQWHMLPQSCPNCKTAHRRLQQWCEGEAIRGALMGLANTLREDGATDGSQCCIDATFASAKGGGDETGPTKRGKGVKIMAIVDRHGLPIAVTTHAADHHEVTLVQLTFDFCMIEAKPEHLIGDRACDSDKPDSEMREQGTEMSRHAAPIASARRPGAVDGYAATGGAGSSSGSLPGFGGHGGSSFAGNATQPVSSASCSLWPSASCASSPGIGFNTLNPAPLRCS